MTLRAGFVGLGAQGGPMAMRIVQSGIPLTVWARRLGVTDDYAAAGARVAPDLAAVGAASDVLGLCVFGDADVLEVAEAVLPGMAAGSVILIHATVHPDTCRTVGVKAEARGVSVLDAPVSGGGAAAQEGRLAVMVGGRHSVLERCRPVIECYAGSGRIAWLGELGAGEMAKLINNTLLAANLGLVDEAVRCGEALGLDRASLNEVLKASSGGSVAQSLYASRASLADFKQSVETVGKDVRLLAGIAARSGAVANRLEGAANAFFADVNAAVAAQAGRAGGGT